MYKQESHIQQLANYIEKNLSKGYTLDSLRFSLMSQGYSKISVDNAIELVNKKLAEKAPIMKEKPQITYKIIADNDSETITISNPKKSFLKRLFGW